MEKLSGGMSVLSYVDSVPFMPFAMLVVPRLIRDLFGDAMPAEACVMIG
jgi:hypothetical protein